MQLLPFLDKSSLGIDQPVMDNHIHPCQAEVRQPFKIPKIGTIAGCYITEGKAQRKAEVRLLRDNVVIFTGKVSSLKRFKDDVSEVKMGFECGIGIANYNDIKEGDVIDLFHHEEFDDVETL